MASFNLRNGRAFDGLDSWPFRRAAAAAAVDQLGADVVALQEAYRCQLRSILRRLPRYRAVGEGRSGHGRGERSPILWDPTVLELLEHRTRWYGADPDRPGTRLPSARFPRVATIARFRLGRSGTEVQVVSTHLDAAERPNRLASAEQLVSWLAEDEPVVVLGDLNAGPASEVVEVLLRAGLRDALAGVEGGTEHRFTGATDGRRIDHVLVRGGWEVTGSAIAHVRPGGRLPSDHWPVVADLTLPS